MKRTTIYLADEDRQAIQTIKQRYGIQTDSEAIRFAVRLMAESKNVIVIHRKDGDEVYEIKEVTKDG